MSDRPGQHKKLSSRDAARRSYERVFSKPVADASSLPADALVVGPEPTTRSPVYLRYNDLQNGLHVLGGPGGGKSNFLRTLCNQLLLYKQKTGNGFGIIDPHGTLSLYVRELAATQYPELAGELVYLDLQQTSKVLSFNPLARATAENANLVASAITEGIIKACGARSSSDLPTVSTVLSFMHEAMAHAGGVMLDMEYFLYRAPQNRSVLRTRFLDQLPDRGPTRPARIFWEDFDQKTRQAFEAATVGPLNRLNRLIRPQEFRRILAAPGASLDARAIMDEGGIALFDLSAPPGTNVSSDGVKLMSALLFQEFNQAWASRVPDQSRPFVMICDEFGDYVSGDAARAITGARKYGFWCVFSHQNLSQLVGPDDDKELLYTVLSIPNKAVFRGLFIDEAEVVARQMYLAGLDPDRIKHVVRSVTWDPIPTKVVLRGTSRTKTKTKGTSESVTETETSARSSGTSSVGVPGSPSVDHDSEAESVGQARMSGYNFSTAESYSKSEQEAYVTFYRKRIQEGARAYESLDEQVFRHAQSLVLAPQGQGAIARQGEMPRDCRVPHMQDQELDDVEVAEFMERVYSGKGSACYQDTAAVDRFLEDRETKLLDSAEPQVDDVVWGKTKKKTTRKRS